MGNDLSLTLAGETLHLLGARALYWPTRSAMLIADLHLGKADLFRRAASACPAAARAMISHA